MTLLTTRKMKTANIIFLLAFLFQAILLPAQHTKGPYLTPHERRVYNSLNNVHKDYQAFKKVFSQNAVVEVASNDNRRNPIIKSGTVDDVFGGFQNMEGFKINWESITNTHANHPERGVLAIKYFDYGLSENRCAALFSGISTIKGSCCYVTAIDSRY